MGTGMVEVVYILLDAVLQMPFAQDEQTVQALPPQAAQKTLAVRVRARSVHWCVEHLDPGAARDAVKGRAIFVVIVADQEPWVCFPKSSSAKVWCAHLWHHYAILDLSALYRLTAHDTSSDESL